MSAASEKELRDQILVALSQIQDPDLNKDIVSLGFIKDLEIKRGLLGSEVRFKIELTTPACPIKEEFKRSAVTALKDIPGISNVEVTMTSRVLPQKGNKGIPGVRNIVAVGSGKGGVGKSTVAVNLALALRTAGARVGFLDADIYGPSAALMLNLKEAPHVKNSRILPVEAYGIPVMTFAFFAPVGEAVIWRGAMIGKAVEQMLFEVDWLGSASNTAREDLDYLIVDLPPGTGDVHLSLIHSVDLAGAVIVSTPQDVALLDAVRGLAMFEKMKVPVIGIVENMSGFVCAHCHETTDIFGAGGAETRAKERGVPFLGKVPLDPELVRRGDRGHPIVAEQPQHAISQAFLHIAKNVAHQLSLIHLRKSHETPAQ